MGHKRIVKEAGYLVNVKKIINKMKAVIMAGAMVGMAVGTSPIVSLAVEPVKVELKVHVETNGDGHDSNEKFTIELKDSNGALLESKEVNEGETTLNFDNMVYTSKGTHHYTISEKQGNAKGYTYDNKNVYNVTVQVVEKSNKELSYSVTLNKLGTDTKSASISFVNTYTRNKETSETPESPESSSEPESSTTPETTTQPTPTPTPTPTNTPATESPNISDDSPRAEREETPYIPVIEELVADTSNAEYVNLAPDPVPLVSLTTLNDEETPKAVLIADEDVPLAVMTGDAFNMILWIVLLGGSAAVIIFILASKLKNRKNNK
jgi:pilin isopeptide linkage protein